MLKKTYFLIATVLTSVQIHSQEHNVDELTVVNEISLLASEQVVFELRENYGIAASVELSKALWQVLSSYSNQQQAETIWQSAINKVTTNDREVSLAVNSHYNSGEVFINYVNGMTAKKWNKNRRLISLKQESLDDFFKMNDSLTIYLNMLPLWDLLLDNISKQQNINWQNVFQKSLNIYQSNEEIENLKMATAAAKDAIVPLESFLSAFTLWTASENKEFDLALLMQGLDGLKEKNLYQSMIKYTLLKDSGKMLSTAMSWFAVAQQMQGEISSITEEDLAFFIRFIEENDAWFLTKEQELLSVDTKLPTLIESSFHQLKANFSNPEMNELIQLTTVYELLDSNFAKYMSSPFRKKIRKDLEVCINISEEFVPLPQEPIDEKQFKGCVDDILFAAVNEAESRELSGSLIKVDNLQALDRALESPVWQTINIMYANLTTTECLKSTQQLPNPVEWTLAAESLLWFADRWPAYMQKYQQNTKVQKIIDEGDLLVKGFDCTMGMKAELLNTEFNRIVQSWKQVETDIQKVVEEFKVTFLKTGSDLDLIDNIQNLSNYRVEGAKIAACNVPTSCGVLIELEPSRALYNLFPKHLLMADQLKQGSVELCYDDIGWDQRRAAPTHLDNNNVANYMGKFSFSLKGFYNEKMVFSRKITDKQEYNYIFAANTEEVLNTFCPLAIVGDKISTKLERGTFGLVPNRLTFLTASRANETDLLVGNWALGEEWENAIASDNAEVLFEENLDDLKVEILTSYQQKAKHLQDIIYKSILKVQPEATRAQKDLASSFSTMQHHKKLLFSYNYLLQMDKLMQDDDLHGIFFGADKVVDASVIREHFENQVNIKLLQSKIEKNLKSNQEKWNALPTQLSNSHIQAILYRLNSIYH